MVPADDQDPGKAGAAASLAETERARRETEARFRAMAESIDDVFYLTDLDSGELLYLSPAYERVWGRPEATLLADPAAFVDTIHPDDRAGFPVAKAAQARGEAVTNEYRILRPDGEERWIHDRCFPVAVEGARWSAGVARDVTERRRVAAVLAENAARECFLLTLEDALRPFDSAEAVQATAARLTAEHFGVDRVHYAEALEDEDSMVARPSQGGAPAMPGRQSLSSFDDTMLAELRSGRTVVIPDVAARTSNPAQRQAYADHGIAAAIAVPLVKGRRLVGAFAVHDGAPRQWTRGEIALAQAVAERTWAAMERVKAERERDRFFDLSLDLLAVASTRTNTWVRVNRAFARVLGWTTADLVGRAFFAIVHPDDLARSAEASTDVERGAHLTDFEHRMLCKDGSVRWIAWNMAPYPGEELMFCVGRDVTRARELTAALRDRESRLELLVQELQHRVRNMLAVVRAVFGRSAEMSGDRDELLSHFRGRLDALARTQTLVTKSAHGIGDLEELIRDELLSVGASDGPRLELVGPEVAVPGATLEMLGLAFHELATNAVKYGALRGPGGRLRIEWKVSRDPGDARRLTIVWTEQGVSAVSVAPTRQGFGRELIEEALPYQIGAETSLEFRGGGLRCAIAVPLPLPEETGTG